MGKSSTVLLKTGPLLFFLFVSCITRPGNQPVTDAGRGNIIVREKNGLSAQVYLDYRMTGSTTPVTFQNIPAGLHTVYISYSNYRSIPESLIVNVAENANNEAEFELQKTESGDIEVQTVPTAAMVTLNNVDFGPSPLSVMGLPTGNYSISALLGNYHCQDTVIRVSPTGNQPVQLNLALTRFAVIEYFSNTNCAGCPAAGSAIDNLMEQLPQYKDMIFKVSYHANFPSPNDPFFLAAKPGQSERVTQYNVETDAGGLPIIYINGTKLDYSNEQKFLADATQRINAVFLKGPVAELAFSGMQRDSLQASGMVTVKGDNSGLLLFAVLIEGFVGYPIPPGTNGQRLFHDIFRGFSPEADGLEINGTETEVLFTFDISDYAQSDLSVVAFLQDKTTKEIVQSQRIYLK